MSKEKQIEEKTCETCLHYCACLINSEYHPERPCRVYKDRANYRKQIEGEWIFNRGRTYGEPAYYCSECSEGASEYGCDNYCPNCGAKMKGGAE